MNKGFTIVELLSVIAILALLVIIMTPAYDSVSNNIRKKSYDSRKSEIKADTISFIEKYAKDKVYDGNSTKVICLSPQFLIRNGIITSDDEKEEYIKNDFTKELYTGEDTYIKITYDVDKKKLYAITIDEIKSEIEDIYTDSITAEKYAFDYNDCSIKSGTTKEFKDNEIFR